MLIVRRLLMFIVYVEDGIIVAVHPNIKVVFQFPTIFNPLFGVLQSECWSEAHPSLVHAKCIEERMHLVWDTMVEAGQISVTDYVCITSTECARIFNIYPRTGAILVGSNADIIILNANSSFEITATSHHSRSDTNVYECRRGKVVPGAKYTEMRPFSYLFDGIDKAEAQYLSSLGDPVKRFTSTA
ncbi:hypothetical protein Pint_30830 [Pistacia integerrima]|uniref:Uncharacterized protein n=1 Tax=Pistacia integerrima TaxID=434235 RepID=A0ACC0XR19_9ROSI|nr:hypothetical protein Pint_30830 [Pistacia integerrima]